MLASLVVGAAARSRAFAAAVVRPSRSSAAPFGALAPFLDTLIPADQSPSATALAVDRRLLDRAAREPGYRRRLAAGCRRLDRVARRLGAADFAALDDRRREAVVAVFALARPGTPARVFFETTRSDAFFHYYAREEAWTGLGYDGPPQPAGFPDHANPPSRAR